VTDESDNVADMTPTGDLAKGHDDYLLGMKILSLACEKAKQLRAQLKQKSIELKILRATDPTTIWLRDLNAVEVALKRDAALHAAETDLSDSSDDDTGELLMPRMQKKLVVLPPPKPLRESNKKRPSPRIDDENEQHEKRCAQEIDSQENGRFRR
jgi:hypothetical protein